MAASEGECSPGDSFAPYRSHADVMSALHLVLRSDGDLRPAVVTQSYLVGANWIIANLVRGQLKRLSGDLGGDVHHESGRRTARSCRDECAVYCV